MRSRIPKMHLAAVWAVTLCVAIGALAQSPPARSLLALSKRNHTLAIVDPNTLRVIARAPVGPDPHEVIASSDGKTAYVSIYGGGRYHALSVIDLVGQKALPDIDTGALNGPHGLAFVGGKLWFTAEGAKAIATYDPVSTKIDWIKGTGQNRTHMIYVAPDQKQIYTTNVSSATVSILEKVALPPMGPPPGMRPPQGSPPPQAPPGGNQPRIDWNETVIPVGKRDEGLCVTVEMNSRDCGPRSHGWRREASEEGVILDLATQPETDGEMLHSPDRDLAFQPNRSFRKAQTLAGNNNLAMQSFTRLERLAGDAIEPCGAEIFRSALNRPRFRLPKQAHRPMQRHAFAFAAVIRHCHQIDPRTHRSARYGDFTDCPPHHQNPENRFRA